MTDIAHEAKHSHVRLYMMVFGALALLTVATVGVSYIHLPGRLGLAVGLLIAAVKAGLVAAVFMHLKWEKKPIFYALGITAFFAVFLFLLPILDALWTAPNRPAEPAAPSSAEHDSEH